MKVYAVRHEFGEGNENNWTLSTDPNKPGWETDSGCDGYGLSKETAEDYAKCINGYKALFEVVKRWGTNW